MRSAQEYQKVSADFTQSCRKSNGRSWGAERLRADKHGFSRWGWAPWVRNLGGPFFTRGPVGDDDETHLHVTYASHLDMDAAFCARMRRAIAAGLENAPIAGTKNRRYLVTEPSPLASPLGGMDF
jgi:hypothetical protein